MSVSITDHTATFLTEADQRSSLALRLMCDAITDISTPKTPKNRGNLRNNVIKQVLGLHGEVRWMKNYAVFQEETQYQHYTTPGTGPHFAEKSVRSVASRSDEYFRRAALI